MKAFWEFLISDPWRKLFALILAIVLYIRMNDGEQLTRDLPEVSVEIIAGEDIFLAHAYKNSFVKLKVRGTESYLNKLKAGDISCKVRLQANDAAFNTGSTKVYFSKEHFNCPKGIEIVAVEPSVLTIPIDRQISRKIVITPDIVGHPQQGRVRSGVRCFPENVTVTGPERALRDLRDIRTETLNIEGEMMTFDKEMKLINPMPGEFSFDTITTNISVVIMESSDISKKFTEIPVRCMFSALHRSADGIRGFPEIVKAAVTVSGPQSEINRISRDSITVFADFSDSRFDIPGTHEVELKAAFDDPVNRGLVIKSIEPKTIKFQVKKPVKNKK